LSKTLCPVDAEIAKLCKKIKCCWRTRENIDDITIF
jgi:hypothetical protein